MNFLLNYENAIKELLLLTTIPAQEEKVIEIIHKAGEYFHQSGKQYQKNDFSTYSRIGIYIQNKELAQAILSHFKWKILEYDIVNELIALQDLYGVAWCLELLKTWKKENKFYHHFTKN
ncbi:hypothetical protein CCS41_10995 [Candidatus Fukatsuia symbiotica]|uniref:Uncharacterized protein n=2 Tax=Yersiniaceae TaxID=1903411 RepID=A0A2U8I6V5_9GAMM|nr:hypothetical protein CCS41_10995 [Candidatus Fukatsuia symbiotica]